MSLSGFQPRIARGQYWRSAGRIEQQERLWDGAPLFQPDNQRGMPCFVSKVALPVNDSIASRTPWRTPEAFRLPIDSSPGEGDVSSIGASAP
ncbi:hypothetical protein [Burkholderia gladioli]|uniref:hypothetical protein n=1 Tax=Burkholderia gladioli TaxID=28095 RepID=UPI0013DE202F|nr:hypothetical protein [Burkholderia gladioli]